MHPYFLSSSLLPIPSSTGQTANGRWFLAGDDLYMSLVGRRKARAMSTVRLRWTGIGPCWVDDYWRCWPIRCRHR
jgi:hypothetical protein